MNRAIRCITGAVLLAGAACSGMGSDARAQEQPPDAYEFVAGVRKSAGDYMTIGDVESGLPGVGNPPPEQLARWISRGLDSPLPGTGARRDIYFAGLDVLAALERDEGFPLLRKMSSDATQAVYDALAGAPPAHGLEIYKLYNEGVILRAPGACIGIDILLEPENHALASGFANILDGLLISHPHGDHFDRMSPLIPAFMRAGKPVILPREDGRVPFGEVILSGSLPGVRWKAFRGGHVHLGFSAFYLIEFGGTWRVLHSGDNTVWLRFSETGFARDIDVFFLKPEALFLREEREGGQYVRDDWWKLIPDIQQAMQEILSNIRPRIVVPHHLLELGHGKNAYGHELALKIRRILPPDSRMAPLHWGEICRLYK